MSAQEDITRVRVAYAKGPSLRFTGHLDLQRLWERLLRRSGLPIRYSQGFHPRARLNLASALPLGFVSDAELLDFWMDEPRALATIRAKLEDAAPPGLVIKDVRIVDLREDSLQSQMLASEFVVRFFDHQSEEDLQHQVASLLAKDDILRTRRKKTYDLRPLILNLEVITLAEDAIGLAMRLRAEPGATGRPDEVLSALGFSHTQYLVRRTQLILSP